MFRTWKIKEQPVKWILIGLLGLFQIRAGIIPSWQSVRSDFPNYYTASRLVLERTSVDSIYNDEWFNGKIHNYGMEQTGKFSPFPPPTVLALIPLASFTPLSAKRIWLILNLALFGICAFQISKLTGSSYSGGILLLLSSGFALANNFFLGQFYLLLLVTIFWGYSELNKNRLLMAGNIWGIGIAIKYFPLILFPAFSLEKNRRLVAGTIISLLVINLLTIFLAGPGIYQNFIGNVLLPHLNGHLSHQSPYAYEFQSWNTLFNHWFVYDAVQNGQPLIPSLLLFQTCRIILHLAVLILFIRIYYRVKNQPKKESILLILLTTSVMLLLPASATYHFILLLIPVTFLYPLLNNNNLIREKYIVMALVLAVGFSPLLFNFLVRSGIHHTLLLLPRLWLVTLFYIFTYRILNRLTSLV